MIRRLLIAGLGAALIAGCGYTSQDNEMIGQVKKVQKNTPLICPDYTSVDVSLGVMRGGVGSMSSEDVWLTVDATDNERKLREANESGKLVKIKFEVWRLVVCKKDHVVRSVEVIQ